MVGLGEEWDEVVATLRDLAVGRLPDRHDRAVPAAVARQPADGCGTTRRPSSPSSSGSRSTWASGTSSPARWCAARIMPTSRPNPSKPRAKRQTGALDARPPADHVAATAASGCAPTAAALPSRRKPRIATTTTGAGRCRASAIRSARVLVIGLAPAAHGANRTGRVFTGDGPRGSGDFLMRAMHEHGFANIPTARHPEDGLQSDRRVYRRRRALRAARQQADARRRSPPCHPHLVAEAARCPTSRSSSGSAGSGSTPPGGCSRIAAIIVRPRPPFGHDACLRGRRLHGDRLVSPEPSEHEHGQADGADDGRGVSECATASGRRAEARSRGSNDQFVTRNFELRVTAERNLFPLRLVDVRRLAEEHLGGFHQRLRQRRMRMDASA